MAKELTKKQKIAKLKKQKPSLYRNINLKKLGEGKTKKIKIRNLQKKRILVVLVVVVDQVRRLNRHYLWTKCYD